ncbi:hypothetical protein [Candidatus Odyssella thessalonicensis]|uniref:hypothetical protein n=1 Tax=Candidatus Odyssella thessalonicensis TaxID=84647 RepID=UPI000225A94E|nr:hypothetical protein [Candidatus Odyssella thessalonicensis]
MAKVYNDIKRGPLANVIALHDLGTEKNDVRGWFTYVVNWFRKNGLEPTRIGITGAPYKGNKTITFHNGLKRLEDHNYQEVQGISLYAIPPNHNIDMFDGIFILEYTCRNKGAFVLCWDNQLLSFDKGNCKDIVKDICSYIKISYGYAFQRLFNQGPSFYPRGVLASSKLSEDEEDRIALWNNEYMMPDGNYQTGDLRDIYPLNILSRVHLDRVVNGGRFEDWIQAVPQRGSLEQITDSLWTWWVEADNIDAVRAALAPSGMILCL